MTPYTMSREMRERIGKKNRDLIERLANAGYGIDLHSANEL